MEEYNHKTKTSNEYDHIPTSGMESDTKRTIFKPSEMNTTLPLRFKLSLFFIGFFGLNLISFILSLIFRPLYRNGLVNANLANSLLTFLSYLIVFGAMIFVLLKRRDKPLLSILKEFKNWRVYVFGLAAFACAILINYLFNFIYQFSPIYQQNANQTSLETEIISYPYLAILPVILFAPFTEELTYRIGLVDTIGSKNRSRWLGIILSSIIFGLIHFDTTSIIYIFAEMIAKQNGTASLIVEGIVANSDTVQAAINNFLVELMNLPVYILSGFTFAFFYCFTGKIATSMFAHSLNNTLSVILVLVSFAISQNSNINISSFLIR